MAAAGDLDHLDFDYTPGEGLPYAAHARLHQAGPVVWCESLGGWLVTSYACVRAVLSDVTRFTSAGTPVAEAFGAEGMLVNDTQLHHTIRAVWARQVSRPAITARKDELEANAARVLDAVRDRLESGETIDFIPLFRQFVMAFIASSFAVPDDRLDVFLRWSQLSADTPALELAEGTPAHERHMAAKNDVFALIREQVEDRRRRFERGEQPDDLISLMVAAQGSDGITPSVVIDNVFNFILGAMDTTEKWLGNIMNRLYGSAELLAELRANRSLIEPFIDEVMRIDTVAQLIQRKVRQDGIELGGRHMKAGDTIYVMLGAANRDPAEFENADSFDMRRIPRPNFGFGFGFHHCMGINIAKLETMAFVNVLLDRLPDLRIAACDRGNSWALWGPRALQVELSKPA